MERMVGYSASAVLPILLVLVTARDSRYLHVLDFTLCEDDFTIVPRAASGDSPKVAGRPDGAWPNAPRTRASVSETHETP